MRATARQSAAKSKSESESEPESESPRFRLLKWRCQRHSGRGPAAEPQAARGPDIRVEQASCAASGRCAPAISSHRASLRLAVQRDSASAARLGLSLLGLSLRAELRDPLASLSAWTRERRGGQVL